MAADRGGQTGFALRTANGLVPVNTRIIQVRVTITRAAADGHNDGSADNQALLPLPLGAQYLPLLNEMKLASHRTKGNNYSVNYK